MTVLAYLLDLYSWVVLAAVVLSWIPDLRDNPIGHAIEAATEPVFAQIRKLLPDTGGLDLSPLVLLLALRVVTRLLR
jgi:YggT family protein